jgi:hypothetical protein
MCNCLVPLERLRFMKNSVSKSALRKRRNAIKQGHRSMIITIIRESKSNG